MRFMTAAVAVLSAMLVTGAGVRQAAHADRTPELLTEGIAASPCAPQRVIIVPPRRDARYDGDTSVLLARSGSPAGGSSRVSPASACTSAGMAASRAWLAAGTVPGKSPASRSMAQRALLDLYLSTRPDGSVVAGWYSGWDYAWPRDSSWVAAALAVTGHDADAVRVLTFLQRQQSRDGTWAARYQPDGSGPVRDGLAELDAVGWVPWAVWSWYQVTHQTVAHQALGAPGAERLVADGQRGGRRSRAVTEPGWPARRRHRLLGARPAGDAGHGRAPAHGPAGRRRHRERPWPGAGRAALGGRLGPADQRDRGIVRLLWL